MLRFLLITLLIYSSVISSKEFEDETVMEVDSDFADYNGKKITLQGNVIVEHQLGSITATWVEAIPETIDKKVCFNTLTMKENIKIALKDGGELCCANASVNYHTLLGQFEGDEQQEYVVYTESLHIPLVVKSRKMQIKIDQKQISSGQSTRSSISDIIADQNVTVNYNEDFIASADHATYHRLSNELQNDKPMPGLIALHAANQNGICQVTNRNGDLIKANNICIDTIQHTLLFGYPRGAIYASREKGNKERIDFAGDTMIWDEKQNKLILRDQVIVSQLGLGQLRTDQEVRVQRKVINGNKQLSSIESVGPTTLTYADADRDVTHTLICHGILFIDHDKLKTTMNSPQDPQGNVPAGKQVYFQDNMGEIYADKLTISYMMEGHSIIPTKLFLEGHVHILNRCTVDPDRQSPYLQYALADSVEYTPQAKEISLAAKGDERVLFFDKLNNLQVSAPGLKIRRDQTTKKESIQGIGNVRFSFVEKEFDEMDKYFHLKDL